MSFITRFALDNDRITMVLIVGIIVVGLQQFFTFPRQEDPPIVIREVVVTAHYPGMAPAEIEELVTSRIEAELRTLPEIEDIWSDSKTGVAVIHATTRDQYNDLDRIWQKVRNKMSDMRDHLPEGTIGPFVNDEAGLTAVATIALWSEGFSMEEMRQAANEIRDRLYELGGIRKVELWGVLEERVFLKYSSTKLSQSDVSIGDIVDTLRRQNVVLPGGKIDVLGEDVIIEPSGNFRTIEDIENVLIQIPGSRKSVQLQDLVTVERGYVDPPKNMAYYNGRRVIVVSVSITPGVNAVEFGERLTRKIRDLESRLPIGYVLEYATFQPDLVQKAVDGALSNVYQTLVIVLAVVMLFLGIRTGLIVGSFVPMTMLMGLVILRLVGVELERISIASAIIALGMLVDNGIVVAEEIRARLERGQERREACIEAGRTLAIPLLTSSLTTILAFLPMLLLDGATGEYIYSLPMVIITLLISSWFLSMFMTPAMSYWFMKVKTPERGAKGETGAGDPYAGRFYSVYGDLLRVMLRLRFTVIAGAAAALVAGGYIAGQLVQEHFGTSDRNQFTVYVDLPAGSNITATDAVVKRLSEWLVNKEENPEITNSVAYVGTGGPRFYLALAPVDADPHVAFLLVNTQNGDQVSEVMERVRQYALASLPEAYVRVKPMFLGGTEPGLVKIRLIGRDPDYLFNKGKQLLADVKALPGAIDMRLDWQNRVRKLQVFVDQARAGRVNVTSQDVALSLESHIDGIKVTEYREKDVAIPVMLVSEDEDGGTLGDLVNMQVDSGTRGASVPIVQIASGYSKWELNRISRRNQERTVTVEVRHEYLKAPELFQAVQQSIEDLQLEESYRWELGGEIEDSQKSQRKLFKWFPPCLIGIVVLLIWQFNSFRRPLIILLTLPLAFTGAFLGLLVMAAPFDFFSILGLFSLGGVIINNGIVMIDRIDSVRGAGVDAYNAVIQSAVSRLRPIIMATVTTVLGVTPLIVWHDPLFYSLAIIMAFGLAFGTVLTLGVVPVLYALLFRVKTPGETTPNAPIDDAAPASA